MLFLAFPCNSKTIAFETLCKREKWRLRYAWEAEDGEVGKAREKAKKHLEEAKSLTESEAIMEN